MRFAIHFSIAMTKIVTIVPAAGGGTRMGDALPKQYRGLNGVPMIFHTLAAFGGVSRVSNIIVVINADDRHWDDLFASHVAAWKDKIRIARVGGATRGESVLNGLRGIADLVAADDWIMVHDAARPCIRGELIERFLDELTNDQVGGLLALPVADTLKLADDGQRVRRTVDRTNLWRAQTPQMFRYQLLCEALSTMPNATDEAEAMEALGYAAKLVAGDSANIKVTYASDVKLAEIILRGK